MKTRIRIFVGRILLSLLPLQAFPSLTRGVMRFIGYKIGTGAVIYSSVQIIGLVHVSIGENSFVGHRTLIWGGISSVSIGSNCDVSAGVSLISGTHKIGSFKRRAGEGYCTDITVGDGTWIGYGATILPGVSIGKGCIIGAGSLVNKNIPDNAMAVGNPARIIKILS